MAAKHDGSIRVECRLSALPLVLQWLKISLLKYREVKWTNISVVSAGSWNCQKQRFLIFFPITVTSVLTFLCVTEKFLFISWGFLLHHFSDKIFNLHWKYREVPNCTDFCSKALQIAFFSSSLVGTWNTSMYRNLQDVLTVDIVICGWAEWSVLNYLS